MKLSEAIKLGAMLKPQGFGKYQALGGSSCALGAALDAHGVTNQNDLLEEEIDKMFPILNTDATCPMCIGWESKLFGVTCVGEAIIHLNDDHGLTREQIADWVAMFEPRDESTPLAAVDPSVDIRERLATRAEKRSSQ
jgi:hypothetical protein